MQMKNLRNFGNQITHCIFSSDGCAACPSHQAGAWTRPVMGKFAILFVDSVVKEGKSPTKAQYVEATGDYSSLVNVYFGDEVARLKLEEKQSNSPYKVPFTTINEKAPRKNVLYPPSA